MALEPPDLNPVGYSVWSVLEGGFVVQDTQVIAVFFKSWEKLDDDYLSATCDAFTKRLKDYASC